MAAGEPGESDDLAGLVGIAGVLQLPRQLESCDLTRLFAGAFKGFTGNYAYYYGGGTYSSTLYNCTLSGNQAYYYYGGAAYSGSAFYARWRAKPAASAAARTTTASLQNTAKATSRTWTAGYYRGEFADGSGTFDLLLEEDGAAFFRAETEDGDWSAECEAEVVGETLLLTFEGELLLVIRCEGELCMADMTGI